MKFENDKSNRLSCLYLVVIFVSVTVSPVLSRPQAVKIDYEEDQIIDRRWDAESDTQDKDAYRALEENKKLQEAIMEVLETLPEKDLRLLEELAMSEYDEMPQGDMPMEDVVEDMVQELPSEDNADLESYHGELVVLDNINSTSGLNYTGDMKGNTSDDTYPEIHKIARERTKEMRIQDIKQTILTHLFNKGTPPVFHVNSTNHQVKMQQELLRSFNEQLRNKKTFPPGGVYTEKVQSFYPSCYVPKNTDEDLWNGGEAMNLWFDLSQKLSLQGTSVNIVAAKLRLHKESQANVTVGLPGICPPVVSEENGDSKASKFQFCYPTSPYNDDKQIRVSVYWFTRSLKKHKRVKRKLLDSQMHSIYGDAWTEWNIRGAVKSWRDTGRNFGLTVEVENEDGDLLPAYKYFTAMNCSKQASISSPLPAFLARAIAEATANRTLSSSKSQAYHYNTLPFPILDLCTIESPESEKSSFYHKIQEGYDKPYPVMYPTMTKENATLILGNIQIPLNETDKHRIRHRNHHHEETKPKKHIEIIRRDDGDSIEEITFEDVLEGQKIRKQIIDQKVIKKTQHKYQDDNDR
uniref:TGF-beta propeptide domain-containing protein n=1 Tax=Clastoptera arizonana TaxID=38151 RepID=A0A1B6C4D2_9HEMI